MSENITKQIMKIITKMIQELSEDTNKKLDELNKVIQNMNAQFSKQLQYRKRFQEEI